MTADLEALKREIERGLDQNLPRSSDIAQPMIEAMRHSVLGGGKRLRPMLVCATGHACGQSLEAALPAACAVEFIHAYSLIHDDLPAMDDDELRHGLPATHVKYGEANAILAGDSLHSLAFETIARGPAQSHEVRLKMIEILAAAAGWTAMAGGQCLDIEAEGRELGLAELQSLHSAKTGALIRVSVQLGALSSDGNVSPEQFALLTEYGDRIGLAFQVMDDVLNVTKSTKELGKPAGSDEASQKNTFPKLMGLGQATALAETLVNESIALLERTRLDTHSLQQLARMVVDRSH